MASKKTPGDIDRQDQIIAEARRYQVQREQSYRAQALKLYPWICARCGREFSGTKLRELTVHHKDHNHDNNPPDGSNWELLCLYCHENEHARQQVADVYGESTPSEDREPRSTYRPFADLKDLRSIYSSL
jgi:HNH endonuclease